MCESDPAPKNCADTKLPYSLSFFWFVLTSVVVVLMNEDIAFLQGYGVRFDLWGFYLVAVSAFAACLSYLVFAHCRFAVKVQWWFFALFLILALGNAIGLLAFPKVLDTTVYNAADKSYFDVHYELADASRIRYLISFSITCFYFYILWGIAPKCLKNDRICDVFLVGGILVCLASIAYSWAVEWPDYAAYFDKDKFAPFSGLPSSFCGNSNTFASLLLFGIVSAWVLQVRRHCWVNYLLGILFTVQILLIFSKTCLFLLAFFWFAYIVYRYLVTVKAHPVRSSVLLALLALSFAGCITLWWALAHHSPDSVFGKYWFKIVRLFQQGDAASLFIRINDCNRLFALFDSPVRCIFGFGAINVEWLLGALLRVPDGYVGYTHNGVIYQFVSGGLLRCLVYAVVLIYALYAFVKALGRRQKTALPLFLGFLLMLFHGFTETTSFLEGNTKSVLGVLTLIYPVLIPMVKKEPVLRKTSQIQPSRVLTLSWFCWLSPLFVVGSLLPAFARAFESSLPLALLLCLAAFVVFAIVPLIVNIVKKESFGRYYIIPFCVSLLLFSALFALSLWAPLEQKWSESVLLCLCSCSTCFLLMSLPPFIKRACPGLLSFISKMESFSLRAQAFFASRNDRREERYYMRKRKSKAREALHY